MIHPVILCGGSGTRLEVDAGGATVLLRTLPLVVGGVCAGAAVYEPDKQRVRRGGAAVRDEHPAAERLKAVMEKKRIDADAGEEEVELDDIEEQVDADGDGQIEELASGERDLIEDTSDLGEDDDDIGELMEHVSEDGEDKV